MNAKEALGPWLKRYWGLEIVMSDSHTVQLSDAAIAALRVLVALRDDQSKTHWRLPYDEFVAEWANAWASARAVLSASDSAENEATK